MTKQQIETFITVAEHLNFRIASEVLYITQPAISKQIALLEHELGFRLFTRTKRDVELTPSGQLFYDFSVRAMSEFDHCCAEARQLQNNKSLSICMQMNVRNEVITNAVSEFIKTHPTVNVKFEFVDSFELVNAIVQHRYDVFVTHIDNIESSYAGLKHLNLGVVGFTFLVKRGYMGVNTQPSSLSAYNGCNFIDPICLPSDATTANKRSSLPMEERIDRINNFGLFPKQVTSVSNWQSVLQSIKLGIGITLVSDDIEIEQQEDFFRIPVDKKSPVLASWAADNYNECLKDFLQILQAELDRVEQVI